ncbi:hypothetical protein, partial [Actinobacillus pleuropneumoniae]|uniref:hypothetical protein n=1 Tax=Actinobacillus pleuropneumoniae TaxID=715 RepID=UPI00227CFEE7
VSRERLIFVPSLHGNIGNNLQIYSYGPAERNLESTIDYPDGAFNFVLRDQPKKTLTLHLRFTKWHFLRQILGSVT